MKKVVISGLLLSSVISASWAESRTVTLSVPGMNCRLCPVTVRKALEKVDGVEQTQVNYDSRTATVIYDDKKVDVVKLTRATKDAGYPSEVIAKDNP
ncbi:MAG: mercuric transport protein periplasmic component [Cellvibrionaceae bacterium]|nr:mercuric transport protein periplasmic component [Cellvibrionaceae bacterium]